MFSFTDIGTPEETFSLVLTSSIPNTIRNEEKLEQVGQLYVLPIYGDYIHVKKKD